MHHTNHEIAIRAFTQLLGSERVNLEELSLAQAATATFPTEQNVTAILYPLTTAEIQRCVHIANEQKVPLYTISRGKNWGYGSRVPYRTNSILLSLERMDSIINFDEKMGTVTLEAGVSFGQLRKYLEANDSQFLIDAPGSTSHASVVGNTLERGFAQGQYGDRSEYIGSMEIVMPSGEIIHTGMSAFKKSNTAALHPQGIGPQLTGLFQQSNLGIVTHITLHLIRKPKFFLQFFFQFRGKQLVQVIDAIRDLDLNQVLPVTVSLYNQKRILSIQNNLTEVPFFSITNDTDLWYGTSSVHGLNMQILRGKQYAIEEAFEKLKITLHYGEINYPNTHYGWMSPFNLKLAYAQKQYLKNGNDPDVDGCGLIWCAPVMPLEGESVYRCTAITEKVLTQFDFPHFISMHKMSGRVAYLVAAIVYDREIRGDDDRAMKCHEALLKELTAAGFYPYRLSQASIEAIPTPEDNYATLLARIKNLIDPNAVLSPGRYSWKKN